MSKSSRRPSRAGSDASARPQATGTRPSTGAGSATVRPGSTTRRGRRERARYGYADRSFVERHRGTLLTIAGAAVVMLVVGFVFLGATAKSYACSTIWQPEATASPEPGQTARLGYVQPNMGRDHGVDRPQRYTLCPPASGKHHNVSGLGPIEPRAYGPQDGIEPMSWVHNLEHGALVVLYRCEGDACEPSGQSRMRQFFTEFPNSPVCDLPRGTVGPVLARFDEMAWPYAALVWGRVMPLQTFDVAQILEFFRTEAERTNPETYPGCQASPSPSAPPLPSVGASPSPVGSASPSAVASPSPAASASPSASPS